MFYKNETKKMSSRTGTSTATNSLPITLSGSITTVSTFFHYAINSILYQRGLYPPESFKRETMYGMTCLTTEDERLRKYLEDVRGQVEEWLMKGEVQVRRVCGLSFFFFFVKIFLYFYFVIIYLLLFIYS